MLSVAGRGPDIPFCPARLFLKSISEFPTDFMQRFKLAQLAELLWITFCRKVKCAPSQEGMECTPKFWMYEGSRGIGKGIEQYRSKNVIKKGNGNGKGVICVICAALGACSSFAQKSTLWDQTARVEFTSLLSESEVLRSSLSFEAEV